MFLSWWCLLLIYITSQSNRIPNNWPLSSWSIPSPWEWAWLWCMRQIQKITDRVFMTIYQVPTWCRLSLPVKFLAKVAGRWTCSVVEAHAAKEHILIPSKQWLYLNGFQLTSKANHMIYILSFTWWLLHGHSIECFFQYSYSFILSLVNVSILLVCYSPVCLLLCKTFKIL